MCAMQIEIERAITAFARDGEWRPDRDGERAWRSIHRELIITLAARHKLPASLRFSAIFVEAGGLISYGPDTVDPVSAALPTYVDRILKGEKPADLPVRQPTKFELVINLKTAKALGLDSAADAARPRRRGDRMRAPRVHHAARRRGGRVAARGARAAAGEAADHRVPGREHAFGPEPMDRRFRAAAARTRLDRGSHRRDRVSLGGGTQRALRRDRGRVRPAQGRCHCHVRNRAVARGKAGDIGHPDRLRGGGRPGWQPAWSRAWRDRAATSPACRSSRPILPASDSNSCARSSPVSAGWRSWPMSAIPPPCWRWARFRRRPARSASRSSHRNPASRGYRARLRGAQGPRGGTLCLRRPAREHATGFASTPWRWRATADDARYRGSTSKRAV